MQYLLGLSLLTPLVFGAAVSSPRDARISGLTTDAAGFAQQSYNYVIVGGGTAGLVVAARLTEMTNVTVGVIEAGVLRVGDPKVDTPAFIGEALFDTDYDWNFQTVPQTHVSQRNIAINRGKMLGGSAGLNFMIWQHGSQRDYDSWSELGISNGWDWDGLLPYFLKTETVTPSPAGALGYSGRVGTNDEFEGRSGLLPIQYNNFYSPLETPYATALQALGVPFNSNPDGGNSTGLFNSAACVDVNTGNRSYSAVNYFLTNQARTNLVVLQGAQVTKINMTPGSPVVATGVEFVVDGTTYSANATTEVVLSAGTIQTPQLLELSGIGNPTILEQYDIPVIISNSDVGENYQDHTHVVSQFQLNDPSMPTTNLLSTNATFEAEQDLLYLEDKTGIYTYTASDISFHPMQQFFSPAELASSVAQLQDEIAAANLSEWQSKQAQIQLSDLEAGTVGQMELLFFAGDIGTTATSGTEYVDILNFGSRHFSRGSVHIGSSDPLAAPLIDPNYFQFTIDKEVVIKGTVIARNVTSTAPLSSYIKAPTNPSSNVTSEADFEQFVLENVGTEWHPVGTASLGPQGAGGVVNDNLIVYGTSNLRVVDASVIPLQIASHIQSTVYAIAEKAADIIKSGN
ncbi:alcohol oxidase [Lentinula aciculospora]|uniref:Alcohol oxidase n=1 Tax=Lentinula aciculospora TaxID=153920 RepID=A0A9W9DX65_9AGAR|nr:alcohol oxidase [Lentinula aciculospora]